MGIAEQEEKMLFGVHDFESARQALAATGALLKDKKNVNITLFHGARDRDVSTFARLLRLTPEAEEEYNKVCDLEEQKVLQQAKDSLTGSGFDAAKVGVLCEGKCHDPAAAMLQLANLKGLDPIVLARHEEPILERLLMGAVTYRLVQMAEWRAIWLIDTPIASHNVLVTLVGATISRRVMEHAVRHFSHLQDSKFTFLHVIPSMPPIYWDYTRILDKLEQEEQETQKSQWMQEYADKVEKFADEGREKLLKLGVPEENAVFKVQPVRKSMAADILTELEEGEYGILIMGRKGSKELGPFRLGSVANKLLHNARRCMICLVS